MADALASRGLAGRSLRRHAARGTIINGAFTVALNTLGLLRGLLVAAFLSASDFGVWGILTVAVGGLFWFKEVGISEKFVQQDEDDQELAFQKAFTLEAIFTTIFTVVVVLAVPVVALVYGQPHVIAPALVLMLAVPAVILQSPLWVYYRTMDFARQRTLQALDPVVGFVVTLALAIAGLGYWSLVLGSLAGSWASAAASVAASPYALRFRYDRGTMREYARFSWPLFFGNGARFIVAQSGILVASRTIGIAAVGYITLSSQISMYTNRVDQILSQTLYPAICAVKDRLDLLFESFVKSNRLALMWGVPFGLAMTLFAPDLVRFAFGEERWHGAIGLMQVFGVLAAANHLAYNWDEYFRARGDTRPIATWGAFNLTATLALTVPLMLAFELDGYAIGMAVATAVSLAGRFYYLARLFPGFAVARHIVRAVTPTIPAVAAVLAVRLVDGDRTLVVALGELVLYGAVTVAATAVVERRLLREAVGYLRRSAPEPRVA